MKTVGLVLAMVAFIVALPVSIPIAAVLHARDQRRIRAAARTARCTQCGAILGETSLQLADTAWRQHIAALHRERPGMRFRLVRQVWAICPACGAQHDFQTRPGAFVLTEPGREVATQTICRLNTKASPR